TPNEADRHGLALNKDGQRRSAFELLSHPNIAIADLAKVWPRFGDLPPKIAEQVEIDAKYDVYLSRQAADIAAYRRDESLELPDGLDYSQLRGLSNEVRQKLNAARPRTIGQAARMDGVTPARGQRSAFALRISSAMGALQKLRPTGADAQRPSALSRSRREDPAARADWT